MNISKRLLSVASLISDGYSVADIGTDHGYIPIYQVLNKKSPYALAMDVNEGPLSRASENVSKYQVVDKVVTRLSDGLDRLEPGETDCIVIAGMGGLLINKILAAGIDKAHAAKEMVLSPHSDVNLVRDFLAANNFKIIDELITYDEGKYYFVLKVTNGLDEYGQEDALLGHFLCQRRDAVMKHYLDKEYALCQTILDNLMHNSSNSTDRIHMMNDKKLIIEKGLAYYEGKSDY